MDKNLKFTAKMRYFHKNPAKGRLTKIQLRRIFRFDLALKEKMGHKVRLISKCILPNPSWTEATCFRGRFQVPKPPEA